MWPAVSPRAELQCDRCDYLLKGLPRGGNCPECGTSIRLSLAAYKRLLRQQPPEHTAILLYVAVGYSLVNISGSVLATTDLLPTFVVFAPALVGLAVVAAQTVNAPRPFHWWAVAGFVAFLFAAGVFSNVALGWL